MIIIVCKLYTYKLYIALLSTSGSHLQRNIGGSSLRGMDLVDTSLHSEKAKHTIDKHTRITQNM